MAVNRRLLRDVTPRDVFDVLRDGRTYARWVVGTRAIRAVDPGWPAPGERLHYTVGYGPLRHDDETCSLAYEPDRALILEARAWPAGTVRIEMTVEPVAGGTRVTIDESPERGLARLLHNPALDGLVKLRNVETLRRLDALVQERASR